MITEFEQLAFAENWNNKLSCNSFTSFRLHNERKYFVGKKLSIMLKGKHLKDVIVIAVKTMKLVQVNEFIAQIDAGYSADEFVKVVEKMYKNKNVDVHSANWDLILCRDIKAK